MLCVVTGCVEGNVGARNYCRPEWQRVLSAYWEILQSLRSFRMTLMNRMQEIPAQ